MGLAVTTDESEADLELDRDELVTEIQKIDAQLAQRKAAIGAYQQECIAVGDIGKHRWFAAKTDYERWRAKAIAAKTHLIAELRDVKAKLRQSNIQTTEDSHHRAYWHLRRAISLHQQKVMDAGYAPTPADEELWALLDEPTPRPTP